MGRAGELSQAEADVDRAVEFGEFNQESISRVLCFEWECCDDISSRGIPRDGGSVVQVLSLKQTNWTLDIEPDCLVFQATLTTCYKQLEDKTFENLYP